MPNDSGKVAIFGPHPMLSVTVEALTAEGGDDIHIHAAGQGVWVARMAAELGAEAALCGFIGGESGTVLRPLLEQLPIGLRLVETSADSGAYIHDRRSGERVPLAQSASMPPSRHEIDDLFSTTCAAALDADVLALCGPYPGEALPLEIYGNLVADVKANGTPVVVDLSPPRLDSALEGKPDLVKINDWEVAKFIEGPVDTEARMRAAVEKLLEAGAGTAIVTRAEEPAMVVRGDEAWELIPPRFERGAREGCGDSMMGALAACMAAGREWEETLRIGAAAGAANFLRHGLGSADHGVVEDLAHRVELRPLG
jgi:1-phosphofructokinase